MHFSSRVQSDKILNEPLGDALGVVPSKNHNGFRLAAHEGYGLFCPAVDICHSFAHLILNFDEYLILSFEEKLIFQFWAQKTDPSL